MSITTVICHTGIQYSFHVQVKLLFLSAPPITMGDGERERRDPLKVLAWLERARESERKRERASERDWNWESNASIKPLGWGEEIYCGTQGLINAAGIALTPNPHILHTCTYTYTHTWLRRERYKHGREIDSYIYKEGIIDFCSGGGRNSTLSTKKKRFPQMVQS